MGGGYGRPFFNVMADSRKFPAVTIAMPVKCCDAVAALDGKKFLASQAPKLPIPNCSMPEKCRCKFQKYSDRRDDELGRRFRYGQERGAWYPGAQRRQSRGRRDAD